MKKALCGIMIFALALSLCACASIFDGEYFAVSDYEGTPQDSSYDGATEVNNYLQLTIAINNLVANHSESGLLHFNSSYPGDIAEDLAAACREVRDDTALGSYAVDYISYDLDRIVAYFEAEVFVFYKRSAEEMENILSVNTADGLYEAICAALENQQTELVAMIGASNIDENAVHDYIDEAYFSHPLSCVERPDAVVNVYSGTGFQRIVEITLDYRASAAAIVSRRSALETEIERLLTVVTSESAPYRALQCLTALTGKCVYSEDAPDTLWSALMASEADSEGMAVAYKALCDMAGIDCVVVEGRLDRAEHYWNIITVDGASYHVDSSQVRALGYGGSFLMNDTQMWGSYWWDDQDYPECSGPLTYAALTEQSNNTPAPDSSPAAGETTQSPAPTA